MGFHLFSWKMSISTSINLRVIDLINPLLSPKDKHTSRWKIIMKKKFKNHEDRKKNK